MLKPVNLNIDDRLRDHKFALEWRKAQAEVQAIDRKRIADLEAAVRRYVVAVDREVIPEGDTEVGAAFRALREIVAD